MTIFSIDHFQGGFVNMFVLKLDIPCCLPASFQCEGQETFTIFHPVKFIHSQSRDHTSHSILSNIPKLELDILKANPMDKISIFQ